MSRKLKFTNGKIGIIQVQKANTKSEGGFILPETVTNLGVVKYADETSELKSGDKVYYGNEFSKVHIENEEVRVMESSNVIAIVEE